MNVKTLIMNPLIIFMFLFVSCVESASNPLLPDFALGEYHVNFKRLIPCDPRKINKIQNNLYLSKTSRTTTELKGNVSFNGIPLDDNLILQANFDVQDSIGGWADNSFVYKKEKGCSTLQSFIKKSCLNKFGFNSTCPIPVGVYVIPGIPATNMESVLTNIPKFFYYGTYRLRLAFINKENEELGCFYQVIEIKRPS